MIAKYNNLDDTITKAMLFAERMAGKQYTRKFEWSPALKQAVTSIRYWKLRLRALRGHTASPTLLQSLLNNSNLPQDVGQITSQQDIIQHLRNSYRDLRENQSKHREFRESFWTP